MIMPCMKCTSAVSLPAAAACAAAVGPAMAGPTASSIPASACLIIWLLPRTRRRHLPRLMLDDGDGHTRRVLLRVVNRVVRHQGLRLVVVVTAGVQVPVE